MSRSPVKPSGPIIVIGASAGGMQALCELMSHLPCDLAAAVFIVQHLGPSAIGSTLVWALNEKKTLRCKLAENGDKFRDGDALIAPPDHHMLLKKGRVLVTKGARENRSRPAIDALFRSAAVAYGNRVIGIVLTGNLDDGTAGLAAIKRCGGICLVQDPKTAAHPDMPGSAVENVKVDFCVPIEDMGKLLPKLVSKRYGKRTAAPEEIVLEAKIAERVLSDVGTANRLGEQVPYNCPNCGGVLWQISKSKVHRYRCHTGHSFTAASLETSQLERIEETLWICLRMLEERRNLLDSTAARETAKGFSKHASLQRQKAKESQVHIERIREMLRSSTKAMAAGIQPKH